MNEFTPYYIVGCSNCRMIKSLPTKVTKCDICNGDVSCEKIVSKTQLKDKK